MSSSSAQVPLSQVQSQAYGHGDAWVIGTPADIEREVKAPIEATCDAVRRAREDGDWCVVFFRLLAESLSHRHRLRGRRVPRTPRRWSGSADVIEAL